MNKVYVRKRPISDGYSWQWRFEAPKENGKRRQYSGSGYKSESEALAAGYVELNKYLSQSRNEDISPTMNNLLSEYTERILYPSLSKGTEDNYRALIANHISPTIGTFRISVITSGQILDLYNKVKDVASEAERARSAMLSINERSEFSGIGIRVTSE